jgi:hypothetical protein
MAVLRASEWAPDARRIRRVTAVLRGWLAFQRIGPDQWAAEIGADCGWRDRLRSRRPPDVSLDGPTARIEQAPAQERLIIHSVRLYAGRRAAIFGTERAVYRDGRLRFSGPKWGAHSGGMSARQSSMSGRNLSTVPRPDTRKKERARQPAHRCARRSLCAGEPPPR